MRLLRSKYGKHYLLVMIIGAFAALLLVGCNEEEQEEKIASLEYTVCEESELPKNLVDIIEDKKMSEFELTYTQDEYMYLVKGYGKQSSGGYSITVDDVYYTQNNVCLSSTLVGPAENDLVLNAATYPYIAVKIESIDKHGVFE